MASVVVPSRTLRRLRTAPVIPSAGYRRDWSLEPQGFVLRLRSRDVRVVLIPFPGIDSCTRERSESQG
jgi:hypothetical protein